MCVFCLRSLTPDLLSRLVCKIKALEPSPSPPPPPILSRSAADVPSMGSQVFAKCQEGFPSPSPKPETRNSKPETRKPETNRPPSHACGPMRLAPPGLILRAGFLCLVMKFLGFVSDRAFNVSGLGVLGLCFLWVWGFRVCFIAWHMPIREHIENGWIEHATMVDICQHGPFLPATPQKALFHVHILGSMCAVNEPRLRPEDTVASRAFSGRLGPDFTCWFRVQGLGFRV